MAPAAMWLTRDQSRVGIVALRFAHDGEFEIRDQRVVLVDKGEVDLDALLDARIGEVLATPTRLVLSASCVRRRVGCTAHGCSGCGPGVGRERQHRIPQRDEETTQKALPVSQPRIEAHELDLVPLRIVHVEGVLRPQTHPPWRLCLPRSPGRSA